jgi:hypothetical protein
MDAVLDWRSLDEQFPVEDDKISRHGGCNCHAKRSALRSAATFVARGMMFSFSSYGTYIASAARFHASISAGRETETSAVVAA